MKYTQTHCKYTQRKTGMMHEIQDDGYLKPGTWETEFLKKVIQVNEVQCQVFELGNEFKSAYCIIKNDKKEIPLLIMAEYILLDKLSHKQQYKTMSKI